jgi:hypothetical protein
MIVCERYAYTLAFRVLVVGRRARAGARIADVRLRLRAFGELLHGRLVDVDRRRDGAGGLLVLVGRLL